MSIILTLAPLSSKKFMPMEFISQLTLESFFPSVLGVMLFANLLSDSDTLKSIQYMPSGFFSFTEFILLSDRTYEAKWPPF